MDYERSQNPRVTDSIPILSKLSAELILLFPPLAFSLDLHQCKYRLIVKNSNKNMAAKGGHTNFMFHDLPM